MNFCQNFSWKAGVQSKIGGRVEVTGQTLGGKVGVRFGETTQRLGCGSLEREITSKRKQCWLNLHELATFLQKSPEAKD